MQIYGDLVIPEVSLAELDSDRLLDREWSVLRPRSLTDGSRAGTFSLTLEGFVLGRTSPAVSVLISDGRQCLLTIPTDVKRADVASRYPNIPHAASSGFFANISSLGFQPKFNLDLHALLEDRSRVMIGSLCGRRPPVRSYFKPQLQPLTITSLGRSGSTLLLRLLGSHPQIVAYNPFTAEARVASYWKDVLLALAEPASYFRQISPVAATKGKWWLGFDAPGIPAGRDDWAEGWLEINGIEALATYCHSRIDTFYRALSVHSEHPDALYFAEKCEPDAGNPLPSLLAEIYESPRDVVLVRDFRDMICSMRAYAAKVRSTGSDGVEAPFGLTEDASEEAFIRSFKKPIEMFLRHWQRRSDHTILVRYEDLVLEPTTTIKSLLDSLVLNGNSESVRTMQASLSEETGSSKFHQTSSNPKASIGRWRSDLAPPLLKACEEIFREALEEFGYADA
jgi:hypothetical protein